MKRTVSMLIACILVITLVGCGGNKHEGEAKTPSGSSIQKGRDYQDVINDFEGKGFTNIKAEVLDDLVTGWMVKDGEVESVSVDGDEDYSSDTWYPKDVEVVVTYHTYPKKESEDISKEKETQNTEEKKPTEESYSEINELINQDLLLSQGWALGKLDPDGKPTENGTPSSTYAFALYIENITYLGDKLRVSVFPEFKQLSDEDKTYVINTVQNMSNVYTNNIPYTTIFINGDAIGNSKVTNTEEFKWD